MNSQRYNQLENLYLKLGKIVGRDSDLNEITAAMAKHIIDSEDYVASTLTNDKNDYDYLKDTIRFWVLTQMHMETNGKFKYESDAYTAKYKVISWMDRVFKKGYDKYVMSQILLGDDCTYYWSLKKNFTFLFKKISDIDKMTRWILRFIELAEKKGYYNFSAFYAENALKKFNDHNILTNETKSMLKSHMR